MTALSTLSPRNLAASSASLRSTMALISSGANSLLVLELTILTLPLESLLTRYGTCLLSSPTSFILRPMKRFTEKKVFSGLTTAWRLAICGRGRGAGAAAGAAGQCLFSAGLSTLGGGLFRRRRTFRKGVL